MPKASKFVRVVAAAALVSGSLVAAALIGPSGPAVAAAASLQRSGPIVGTPHTGWYSAGTTNEHFSSPAIGNMFGTGLDTVTGYPDGTVHIAPIDDNGLHPDVDVFQVSPYAIQASPVIVDINKDGRMDVVVADLGNLVEAFTPSQGNLILFRVNTGPVVGHSNGNFATPAVADINHDGILDIVETSWSQYLHVWSTRWTNGRFPELPGFPIHLQDSSWSSPVVADLDRDGWPEIVFGYDCDGAPGQACAPNYGGYVTAIRHDGRVMNGWPRFIPHQTVWSTPAVADINGDGWLDVVVGTGNMGTNYQGKPMDGGHYEYAFSGVNGTSLKYFPIPVSANTTSSPALGHLAHPTQYQAAFMTEDGYLNVISKDGWLLARTCANDALSGCSKLAFHQSPVIADIDGTGTPYIIVGGEQWLDVYHLVYANSQWQLPLVYRGWPSDANHGSVTPHQFTAAPTIVNTGSKTWIVLATDTTTATNTYASALYAFTTGKLASTPPAWGTFKHDSLRTGHV
jgi:hypothetical protein